MSPPSMFEAAFNARNGGGSRRRRAVPHPDCAQGDGSEHYVAPGSGKNSFFICGVVLVLCRVLFPLRERNIPAADKLACSNASVLNRSRHSLM